MRWYNQLVDELIRTQGVTEYAVAKKAGLSQHAVHNARTGSHYISTETLERILDALGYRLEPVVGTRVERVDVPLHEPPTPPTPDRGERAVIQSPARSDDNSRRLAQTSGVADADSYCWGCGADGTMKFLAGHWQCVKCHYIEPCCGD